MEPPKDPQLLNTWVELAPPSMIAEWLSTVTANYWLNDSALKAAKERNDSFINFNLALYAYDNEILSQLWRTKDVTIRRAILCNCNKPEIHYLKYFTSDEELKSFYEQGDLNDIRILVTNPTFGNTALCSLFGRKDVFADLTDERWREIAVSALLNPNLHKEYDEDRFNPDGHKEYLDRHSKSLALRLLFDIPPGDKLDFRMATGFDLFPYIEPPGENLFVDISPPSWKNEFTDKEREEWNDLNRKYYQECLNRFFILWTLPDEEDKSAIYFSKNLRMIIASKVPTTEIQIRSWLEEHADPWVRIGAAKSKYFSQTKEVDRWYLRDGQTFLESVYSNPCFHQRSNALVVWLIRASLYSKFNL